MMHKQVLVSGLPQTSSPDNLGQITENGVPWCYWHVDDTG